MKKIKILFSILLATVSVFAQNTFPTNGDVGIGTSNPSSPFHVAGMPDYNWLTHFGHTGLFGHQMYFGYSNPSPTNYGLLITGGRNSPSQFDLAVENKFYLMGNGDLGLGTSSPLARFDIRGGNILVKNLSNTTGESVPMIMQSLNVGNYTTFGTSINSATESAGSNSYALQFFTQDSYLTGLTEKLRISANGDVGIGTATPREKLSVNGKIRAHEVKVETANWPDYVFEKGYELKNLDEIEKFIEANKHLPEVPSAKEVEKNGIELGEMNKILLKKIEELTLYLIDVKKENRAINEKLLKVEKLLDASIKR
jgi:hypothetical protein